MIEGLFKDSRVKDSYKEFFQTQAGKIVLSDLSAVAKTGRSAYSAAKNSGDQVSSFEVGYMSGVQDLFFHIIEQIDIAYMDHVKENIGRTPEDIDE